MNQDDKIAFIQVLQDQITELDKQMAGSGYQIALQIGGRVYDLSEHKERYKDLIEFFSHRRPSSILKCLDKIITGEKMRFHGLGYSFARHLDEPIIQVLKKLQAKYAIVLDITPPL